MIVAFYIFLTLAFFLIFWATLKNYDISFILLEGLLFGVVYDKDQEMFEDTNYYTIQIAFLCICIMVNWETEKDG